MKFLEVCVYIDIYDIEFILSYIILYYRTIPVKKKCKKAKWLSEEALKTVEKKKRSERQRRKGKIYPSECRVPKKSKEME